MYTGNLEASSGVQHEAEFQRNRRNFGCVLDKPDRDVLMTV